MQARQRFATKGYIVLFHIVPEEKANEWRHLARTSSTGLVWFGDIFDTKKLDVHREHALAPDQMSRKAGELLRVAYKTFLPDSEVNEWRFLKTVSNSKDQPPRRDFPPCSELTQLPGACSVPGSIIVVLQNDTYIYGFGWNAQVALRSERELIRLNKGDIILLRGDFIYAPVGYETANVCLQAFLDVPFYQRAELHQPQLVPLVDYTLPSDDRFCYAWNCGYVGSGCACVRKHLNRGHGFCFQATDGRNSP